jgi:tetratricopeptide (TPR) repeat protein
VQGEDPLVAEGDAHFKAGAYHNAITTYRDAISRNPNNPEAHYKLALALAITGRLDAAVAEWKIVVQLDPSNQGARDNIARAEARLYGTPAPVAAAPPPPTPPPKQGPDIDDLFLKAVQANNQGDYQTAANVIDELLRIKQDHAKAYVVRGDAMLGLGQMDEAVKSYNSAMVFDPGLSSPLFGLAESYRLLANREKSVHYYKLFLQSNDPGKDKWRADRAARMLEIMDGEK